MQTTWLCVNFNNVVQFANFYEF